MIDLNKLTTESRNPNTMNLDEMSALEIVTVMNKEDQNVINAIEDVKEDIAKATEVCARTIENGGRIIYMGAGTSGRLGLLDAVECPPTFGVDFNTVVAVLAGGTNAFVKAKENAEDSETLGEEGLKEINITKKDVLVGIAASGRTPFVIAGLDYANSLGCETICIACNKNSKIGPHAKYKIEVDCGPEILTGSTRLKAGTSQKLILNMLSTGAMVLNGKSYSNLMVDVKSTNEKLVARAKNIVMQATGCSMDLAEKTIAATNGQVKLAVTMILLDCSLETASRKLDEAKGHIKEAIK